MVLACHVILQDHVIKGLCDFMGSQPIKLSYHPAKFGGHRYYGCRDIMVFVCYVALQDHMTRASCDFMVRSFSR